MPLLERKAKQLILSVWGYVPQDTPSLQVLVPPPVIFGANMRDLR